LTSPTPTPVGFRTPAVPSGLRRAPDTAAGFSLIETLIAMFILTFGLLAVGQLLFAAMSAQTLARSKGSGAVVADDRMEMLADLYRQNPNHADLTVGNHGPVQVDVTNPVDGAVMNRFNVAWTVSTVVTNGKTLRASQVVVTVTPIQTGGTSANLRTGLNKVVNVVSIFSTRSL
jgi:Tfp pilus assembly protein PilV